MLDQLSEPGKQALDYSIGAVGLAFFLKLLPIITGIAALALIVLRVVVGVQEWRLNRMRIEAETRSLRGD